MNNVTKRERERAIDCVLFLKLMVAEALNIVTEKYFAILLDRGAQAPVIVASQDGGVDIEQVPNTQSKCQIST